jgi:putative flippase GtrA
MLTRRFSRFAVTGVFNTALHSVVAVLWIQHISDKPSVANAVAFTVATFASFFINTLWSFSSVPDRFILSKFMVVALVGLPIAAGVSGLVDEMGLQYQIGIAAVLCVMPPVNFLLHNFWTYRSSRSALPKTNTSTESQNHE